MKDATSVLVQPVVSLRKVGHSFPGRPWLFRRLSQDFYRGLSYALTGPSGSGKSTLLSLISGWETPREGSVDRSSGSSTRWVFQNPHGVRNRSVLDHVVLPLIATGMPRREAIPIAKEYLTAVGLVDVTDRRFAELSGGEAQRLMLARGLAATPDVLLVDEPTAQLDFTTADTVNQALAAVKKHESTVIVATHDERTRDACDEHVDISAFSWTPGETDEVA